MEHEQILQGGNITPVVRVGDTVRRAMGPWSASVHDLLRYLERRGFAGAPRVLGVDDQGRETLTFIEGVVGHAPSSPDLWAEITLARVGRFIRAFHDVVAEYTPQTPATWQFVYPDAAEREIICHNDIAPFNMLFQLREGDGAYPRALIDFDMAGPGPRRWDLAYAAYRFAPLSHTAGADTTLQRLGLIQPELQGRRLQVFCDAYGASARQVLDTVDERLEAMCAYLVGVADSNPALHSHLAHYQREIAYCQQQRQAWASMLTT